MTRILILGGLIGLSAAFSTPASADGKEFETKKGGSVQVGTWYEFDPPTCKQMGTATLRILKAPSLGSLTVSTRRARPSVDWQRVTCPDLILDQIVAVYKARANGDDAFQFQIDYTKPLPGDWSYSDTVHVR